MEETTKKRVRHEFAADSSDSPESKIPRVDSSESSVLHSDVQLQHDIFNMLDDADNVPDRDTVQGLDSVIKSFEDEIKAPTLDPNDPTQVPDSGELQTKLGYLLEASDDELGLPPTEAAVEEEPGRVDPALLELAGFNGFEDYVPGFDAFGFGSGFAAESDGGVGSFVTVDGLFDYADSAADVLWRSESLQAM
ncbi:hypothetical protein LR48_Vigan10g020500 [Vigna angularis]|uniref:Uncharacterized protein n=2 Tax=Phaseolus angularis TaxID=3914 RepID=A0A0L9VH44_PHAAN|nr:uncharacterized protein LOC108344621 [Vigna angularis]KAG2385214.1 uncharacterized protein HKW66_Vig0123060 [Vigna angularis]KOM54313.1 hypothetical protein LR48_Vigan10g020500 [Vigna angularis]BAU02802.1 hypothetical protein VIGAN_11238600 [Vigna angularis var. angularis]